HIFKSSKQASASFIGGIMKNYDSNFVIEADPEYVIAEADEFDYSFLKLKPQKAIITSIDPDHLDIYQNKEIFEQAFIDFVKNVDSDGLVLLSNTIDRKLIKHINIKTYGIEGNADIIALNIKPSGDTYVFDIQFFGDVVWLDVTLGISGLINVSNALAATILAYESGISEESIREALASFKGIKRRFDIWFDDKQRAFVDDYAHHPEEIKTLYKGLRHKFGGRKLVAIFQPHLYSRTKDFAVNFASALSLFDEQIVLPIYPARELPIKGVTSNIIFDKIKSEKKYLFTKLETTEFLKRNSVSAVYITIGAGDIDRELEQWSEIIKSQIL
ncbi:MAG: UDP-N-acetylmuramate--L-alanine ligase, partial [Bacteroidales bacterium]|nr:UDP-N-acetylmuramate--L-alanine ligase [Bacteroidales bacterium]